MYSDRGWWWKIPSMLSAMAAVATVLYAVIVWVRSPAPPAVCVESAEVVTATNSGRECPTGGRLWTEALPPKDGREQEIVIHCVCGDRPIDAGLR